MIVRIFLFAGLTTTILLFQDCSSPALRYHSDETTLKERMSSTAILADVDLIEDTMGDTVGVNVAKNKSFGSLILNYFGERMTAKHYAINNLILTSVGIMMNQHQVYRLMSASENNELDLSGLPIGIPPFYANEIFEHDPQTIRQLATMYRTLVTLPADVLVQQRLLPASGDIGKTIGASTLMFIVIGGYNMSASKRLTEQFTSNDLTVGTVGQSRTSQLSLTIFIIDARTGDFLWSDQITASGGNVNTEKFLFLADKLINELP